MMTRVKKVEFSIPTYSIHYRPTGDTTWQEIKDITSDGYIEDMPIRYFITAENERHEICGIHNQFWFKSDRNKAMTAAEKASKRSKPRLAIT